MRTCPGQLSLIEWDGNYGRLKEAEGNELFGDIKNLARRSRCGLSHQTRLVVCRGTGLDLADASTRKFSMKL